MVGGLLAGAAGGAGVAIVISAIDDFSKTFEKVDKKLVAIGTGITAAGVGGAALITNFAKEAGSAAPIMDAFNNMLGKDAPAMMKKLQEATRGTVSDVGLMTQANQAMLLGIDPNALPSMFEGALAASQATGSQVGKAIEDITTGIGRQSKLILDNLGIMVDTQGAYDGFAESLGKASDELTDAEKKTAFMNATMAALTENAERIGTIENGVAIQTQQMGAAWANAKVELGEHFLPIIERAIELFTPVLDFFQAHPTIAKWTAITLGAGTALALIGGPLLIIVGMLPAISAGLGLVAAGMGAVSIAGAPVWAVLLAIIAAIAAVIVVGYFLWKHWDAISVFFVKLWGGIKDVFWKSMKWIKQLFLDYHPLGLVIKHWEVLKGFFGELWTGIKDTFKGGVNFMIGLAESWANVWIKAINFVIGALNKIQVSIPSWVPGIGGKSFGVNLSYASELSLPRLAEGGIINKPTLALIGEAGPEAVIPLDKYHDNHDKKGITIYINNLNGFNGRDIADQLQRELNKKVSLG